MNEMKAAIKATNRKLMSTVSQLSVYKATSIHLNMENEDLTQTLGLATRNMSRGMAPVPEAEEEWYKMELRRLVIIYILYKMYNVILYYIYSC